MRETFNLGLKRLSILSECLTFGVDGLEIGKRCEFGCCVLALSGEFGLFVLERLKGSGLFCLSGRKFSLSTDAFGFDSLGKLICRSFFSRILTKAELAPSCLSVLASEKMRSSTASKSGPFSSACSPIEMRARSAISRVKRLLRPAASRSFSRRARRRSETSVTSGKSSLAECSAASHDSICLLPASVPDECAAAEADSAL